jgi:hypothetical protein
MKKSRLAPGFSTPPLSDPAPGDGGRAFILLAEPLFCDSFGALFLGEVERDIEILKGDALHDLVKILLARVIFRDVDDFREKSLELPVIGFRHVGV